MSAKITIRTELLFAVSRWTVDYDNRPHLRVVLFKDGEMMACDGHRLVRVPVACNGLVVAIDRDMIGAAAAAQKQCHGSEFRDAEYGGHAVEISLVNGRVAIDVGRFVLTGPRGDADSFPPVDKVMPDERPERHPDGYGFSARYLASIHEVQKAAGASDTGHGLKVTGWSADGLGPMLFEGYQGIRYVIMPMRV